MWEIFGWITATMYVLLFFFGLLIVVALILRPFLFKPLSPPPLEHALQSLKKKHKGEFQIDGYWNYCRIKQPCSRFVLSDHTEHNVPMVDIECCRVVLTIKLDNVPLLLSIGNPRDSDLLAGTDADQHEKNDASVYIREKLVEFLPEDLRDSFRYWPMWLEKRELKIARAYDCELNRSLFSKSLNDTLKTALECARQIMKLKPDVPQWLLSAFAKAQSSLDRIRLMKLLSHLFPDSAAVGELCQNRLQKGCASEQVIASLHLGDIQNAVDTLLSKTVLTEIWEDAFPKLAVSCQRRQLEQVLQAALLVDSHIVTQLVLSKGRDVGFSPGEKLLVKALKEGRETKRLILLAQELENFGTDNVESAILELYDLFLGAHHESKMVINQALLSLGKIGTARSLPILQKDDSTEAKEAIANIKARIALKMGGSDGQLSLTDAQKSGQLAMSQQGGDLTVVD